jgi:hypothetical protein
MRRRISALRQENRFSFNFNWLAIFWIRGCCGWKFVEAIAEVWPGAPKCQKNERLEITGSAGAGWQWLILGS